MDTLTVEFERKDQIGMLKAFKTLEKEASKELRKASVDVANLVVTEIKREAYFAVMSGQSVKVAQTARAVSDRVPKIRVGGTKVKFSGGAVSGMIVYGNEFGGKPFGITSNFKGGRRFPSSQEIRSHSAHKGNFILPSLHAMRETSWEKWIDAYNEITKKWANSGIGN